MRVVLIVLAAVVGLFALIGFFVSFLLCGAWLGLHQ